MKERSAAALALLLVMILCASCGRAVSASSSEEAVFAGRTLEKKAKGTFRASRPYGKELLAEMLETVLDGASAAPSAGPADPAQGGSGEVSVLLRPDGTPLRARMEEIRRDLDALLRETYTLGAFFDSTDFLLEPVTGIPRLTLIAAVNEAAAGRQDYLPGGAYFYGAWSEELVRDVLLAAIREGRTEEVFVFTEDLPDKAEAGTGVSGNGYADTAKANDAVIGHAAAVKADTGRILDDNAVSSYYLSMSRTEAAEFDDGLVLTVSMTLRDDAAGEVFEAADLTDGEIAELLISRNSDWTDLFAIRCEGTRDWRETAHVVEVAAANDCADLACPLDSYYTSCVRGAEDEVLEFSCDFIPSYADREEKVRILRDTVEAEGADLMEQAAGLTEEEQYRLVTDRVLALTDYDTDLADRISSDALAGEDWFLLSAYGALVEGHTVCSGYAAAMKALCDFLGLPCWIVSGTAYVDGEAEGHSWNAVRVGGETYYIDATFLDAGHDSYFLFTRNEFGDREAEDYWFLPW
ncbi:MAG: hypothetical protein IIY46_05345 [Lachnospiraceae bacterium]|nr:hypothetical protein [Lachnospiraceae bacterium]